MLSILSELLNGLFSPRFRYTNNLEQLRARVTLLLGVLLAAAALSAFIGFLLLGERTAPINNTLTLLLATVIVQLTVVSLVHAGQLRLATLTLFGFWAAVALGVVFYERGGTQQPAGACHAAAVRRRCVVLGRGFGTDRPADRHRRGGGQSAERSNAAHNGDARLGARTDTDTSPTRSDHPRRHRHSVRRLRL